MEYGELFIHLAEIAGVFVAFGALIMVRAGGASGSLEVGLTRGMVTLGLLTVVAALAPLSLAFYDLPEHEVWALSSVVVLVGFAATVVAFLRTPEYRANWATELEAARTRSRPLWSEVAGTVAFVGYLLALLVPPVVILTGRAPRLEQGLYFTAVVMILLGAAWLLLSLVFAPRPAPDASDGSAPSEDGRRGADAAGPTYRPVP